MKYILNLLLLFLFPFLLNAKSISVTAPNGGERLNSCTAQNITWTSTGTSNYYNIDYSLDNGATWSSIATSYNTVSGTFSWNVPNVSSVNSIVRVTDALDVTTFDISNNVFVINGALIVLTPNGGENYITGTTQNITYSYLSGVVNNIKIDYTYDNGITWNPVTSNTSANGSYAWTVPNTPSTSVKIKLTDLTDPGCKTDTSNSNFIITSSLSVVTPNGGETLQAVVGTQGITVIMNNAAEKINTASFFDDGGLQSNYSNTSFTKTLAPDFPTNKLKVTFQSYTLESGDILYIYDGPSTSSSLIATLSGNFSGAVSYQATNATGTLTFKFQSDGDANVAAGWDVSNVSIKWTKKGLN